MFHEDEIKSCLLLFTLHLNNRKTNSLKPETIIREGLELRQMF